MMLIHESNLFELEIEMKFEVCNLHTFKATLLLYVVTRKPDLCDASAAVFYQLSYQASWELVVMCIDYRPVDDR